MASLAKWLAGFQDFRIEVTMYWLGSTDLTFAWLRYWPCGLVIDLLWSVGWQVLQACWLVDHQHLGTFYNHCFVSWLLCGCLLIKHRFLLYMIKCWSFEWSVCQSCDWPSTIWSICYLYLYAMKVIHVVIHVGSVT